MKSDEAHLHRRNAVFTWAGVVLALGIHGAALFAWKVEHPKAALLKIDGDNVEVALVESAAEPSLSVPDATPVQSAPPPPPVPAAIEPLPEPPQIELPPTPPPQNPQPAPEPLRKPTAPEPKPESIPQKSPTPPAKPAQNTSPKPSTPNPNVPSATTSHTGSSTGKPVETPLYLVKPQIRYPSESRSANEQGIVVLRITVNANGRPTAVQVAASSGFARLDRAAVEGGWRCRISNATEGAQFEAPLRFSLKE
jgi:protein TonB